MHYAAEVSFIEEEGGRTTVILKLEYQMPWLLIDMKVGVRVLRGFRCFSCAIGRLLVDMKVGSRGFRVTSSCTRCQRQSAH